MTHYVFSGATSATGNSVARKLAEKVGPENITCLVRPTSDVQPLRELCLRLHTADVTKPESYRSLFGPNVIYLDMTHPKYYNHSIAAVQSSCIERAYFVTTTGIFSKYHLCSDIYKHGEQMIRSSGLTYTILRPSMIYGSLRDKNMNRLIRFLARSPMFPIFGTGRSLMQPVYVEDLARGIVSAIGDAKTENQEYNLAGPHGIAYRDIVRIIARTLGRRPIVLYLNMRLAAEVARVAQRVPGFPINREQVLRLLEDKVFDISKAATELSYRPRSFEDGIRLEIDEMRVVGAIR